MFCFSSFDGTLTLNCQVHSTAEKPEEEKEEMPKGSGTVFVSSVTTAALMLVLAFCDSSTQRKQWKDEIENRLLRIEAVNIRSFKILYKKYLRTFYFEIIHKRFINFKAIENTSCSIWVLHATNRKLMKLADGKLFQVARMKADKNFRRAVQNWLDRKLMHELQHEVIYGGKSFTCISDGLWGEHYCSGARSWSSFR